MAPSLAAAVLLFLLAPTSSSSVLAAADDGTTTHLHVFMHDILTGSNPTAVQVIKGPAASSSIPGLAFGDTTVIDDALTEGPSASSAAVGRAQGFYMMTSSQSVGAAPVLTVCANLVLTSGDYNGSTVAVMGRDDIAAEVRELAVVGGTGRFRMATGYVLWKTNSSVVNGPDATIELDVYVATGGGAVDSSAPVSPVDGGGGGGGSSSAAAVRVGVGGWVSAVFVAVVVAVVGSYV